MKLNNKAVLHKNNVAKQTTKQFSVNKTFAIIKHNSGLHLDPFKNPNRTLRKIHLRK